MTSNDAEAGPGQTTAKPDNSRSFGTWLKEMPRWKKITLGVAVVSVVAGGIFSLMAGDPAPSTANGGAGTLQASLIEGGTTTGGGSAADEPASKGFFRIGFSFLAGFCIGTFLRATLKIAAIAFGFWLLMTFGLSYIGIVNVDWNAMDSLWNRFAGNVESEWGNFQSFMLGSLPATGLAVTGLAVGLKRH